MAEDYTAAEDGDCPRVSLLFAARDEARKTGGGLSTLRQIDYPALEIVAANDRSNDGTGKILRAAAGRDPRLKVVEIDELPAGWLGKPHALQRAYQASVATGYCLPMQTCDFNQIRSAVQFLWCARRPWII